VTDGRSRRIPNPLPLALALVGLVRIAIGLGSGAGAGAAALDLVAAAAVFLAGGAAFRFRMLGGGDVKLFAAAALWLGAAALGPFVLATALAGGALALGFLLARHLRPDGLAAGLPYGIAIAAGGILVSAGAWA
jgi:prepilin peptidase CpaA